MKKIECIIRPAKLVELEESLRHAGVGGMTVTEAKGFGREQTRPEEYLFLPKTKVEIYCMDDQADEIIKTIYRICNSGKLGNGKIAVLPVEDLIRIRTFERGLAAI